MRGVKDRRCEDVKLWGWEGERQWQLGMQKDRIGEVGKIIMKDVGKM